MASTVVANRAAAAGLAITMVLCASVEMMASLAWWTMWRLSGRCQGSARGRAGASRRPADEPEQEQARRL